MMVFKIVEVSNEVNSWAKKETISLVKDLLPFELVHNLTILIFSNALC